MFRLGAVRQYQPFGRTPVVRRMDSTANAMRSRSSSRDMAKCSSQR